MKALSLPANWTHRHYETVASTMLCCDPFAVEPGHFLLITADEQTDGRGQRGTHWESTRGENLTFNVGWRAPLQLPPLGRGLVDADRSHWPMANEQFLISEITALAVLHAIEDTLSESTSPPPACRGSLPIGEGGGRGLGRWRGAAAIKWPNDIYIVRTTDNSPLRSAKPSPCLQGLPPYRGGRGERPWELEGGFKICGMLLEHQLSGRNIEASIAGIGINVNQRAFATEAGKAEGRGAPISLRQILGHEVSREAVLEAFVRHFMEGVVLLHEGRYEEVESAFTAHLFRRTGLHRYRDADGTFLAEFVRIARNGILTLRKADGTFHDYAFKEITFDI